MSVTVSVYEALSPPIHCQIAAIRHGSASKDIARVRASLGIDLRNLLIILGMRERSGARHNKEHHRLDPGSSERLLRVAEIERLAGEVFGDTQLGRCWLISFNAELGAKPVDILDTGIGASLVCRFLKSIEHGLPV